MSETITPEQILELRHALRRTQEQMARLIGVSAVTWCRWEKGTTKVGSVALVRTLHRLREKYITKEDKNDA